MTEFKREEKYEVIKLADIRSLLTEDEKEDLLYIIGRVHEERLKLGKPECNKYVVVNEEEPYAELV